MPFPPPSCLCRESPGDSGLNRCFPLPLFPPPGAGVCRALAGGLFPPGPRWLGSAVVTFRHAGTTPNPFKPTTAFVTHGPYRFTRNPMYVGWVFVYVGAGLLARALWPLVLLPVVILLMRRRVIALEEAYLERRFKDEYRAYRARVRRWLYGRSSDRRRRVRHTT